MSVVFDEKFLDPDNTQWNKRRWWDNPNQGGGNNVSWSISGNKGVLSKVTAGSNNCLKVCRPYIKDVGDLEITGSYSLTIGNPIPFICFRGNGAYPQASPYNPYQTNCYIFYPWPTFFGIGKNVNNSLTTLQNVVFPAPVPAAGEETSFRLRAVGSSIKARAWRTASGEPSTWALDITDSTFTNGYINIGIYQTNAVNHQLSWHRFTIDDLGYPVDRTIDPRIKARVGGGFV